MCSSVLPYSTCDSSEVIANPQNWSLHISEYSPEAPYTIPTGEALPVIFNIVLASASRSIANFSSILRPWLSSSYAILVKTNCMGTIAWKQDPQPLVTLGNAIDSFLDQPDRITEGNCIKRRIDLRATNLRAHLSLNGIRNNYIDCEPPAKKDGSFAVVCK